MRTCPVRMKLIVMLLQNYYKIYVEAKQLAPIQMEAILRQVASGLEVYSPESGLEGRILLANLTT